MHHTISSDRKLLTITCDADEREMLRRMDKDGSDSIQSDRAMHEFFEPLIANSELEWINPADTGDLTDAPMLGIFGEEYEHAVLPHSRYGERLSSACDGVLMYQPILERWGFSPYQVVSVLETLRDTGQCVFSNNW